MQQAAGRQLPDIWQPDGNQVAADQKRHYKTIAKETFLKIYQKCFTLLYWYGRIKISKAKEIKQKQRKDIDQTETIAKVSLVCFDRKGAAVWQRFTVM